MSSRGKREIPKLGIDIVSGCNLRCLGCPNSSRPADERPHYMTPERLSRCIEHIDMPVKLLRLFNFGEPMLHPGLTEIGMVLAPWKAKTGTPIEISTNAQLSSPRIQEFLQGGLVDRLVVSADGDGTPAEYERLRPPAKWSKLLAFLRMTRELPQGMERVMRICIPEWNLTWDTPKLRWLALARRFSFEPQFRPYHYFPGSQENLTGKSVRPQKRGACKYMRGWNLYVDSGGAVTPCCVHPHPFAIGSLLQNRAGTLLRRKHGMAKKMAEHRWGPVCRECQFT